MFSILVKKAFRFQNPADQAQILAAMQKQDKTALSKLIVEVRPDAHGSPTAVAVPDWVRSDPMYQWGVNDGDILELANVKGTAAVADGVSGGVTVERTIDVGHDVDGTHEKTSLAAAGGGTASSPGATAADTTISPLPRADAGNDAKDADDAAKAAQKAADKAKGKATDATKAADDASKTDAGK